MDRCDTNVTFDESEEAKYTTTSWCIILIFVPLVTAFGILSNFAFIFVMHRVQTMRTTTNLYLVNLAVADSSLLVVAFAQYIGSYINTPVYNFEFSFNTNFGCMMPNFLVYLCYYASLWTITLVSIERYLAICRPLLYRYMNGKQRAIYMICTAWLISALFASILIPYTTFKTICIFAPDDNDVMQRISNCFRNCPKCTLALHSTDLLQFVIAFTVNIILYSLTARTLIKSTLNLKSTAINGGSALQRKESKKRADFRISIVKMLIINGIVCFFCLMPFTVLNVHDIASFFGWFPLNDDFIAVFSWIGRVLFLLNSALNPLLYNATNRRYRSAFKQVFWFPTKYKEIPHGSSFSPKQERKVDTQVSVM